MLRFHLDDHIDTAIAEGMMRREIASHERSRGKLRGLSNVFPESDAGPSISIADLTPAPIADKVVSRVSDQNFKPSKVAPRALPGETRPDFLRNEPEVLSVARCQRFH